MSEIKTITSLATETEIEFNDFWQFVWVKNIGDGDCYVSNKSGVEAGGVDVIAVKANETAMVITETQSIYSKGATTLECHGQNFAECPFKRVAKGGEQIDVTALNVTTNGVYTAPSGTAYSPVTVDVQEQPWEPLEDGYSNFWFELTNDTLSPWLNFSATNNDAVIDWGDGSGEVALDTLTPTHTYSKAGRYVVKCKGVTGITQQLTQNRGAYLSVLKAVELNDDVVTLASNAFVRCLGLEYIELDNITTIGTAAFNNAVSLKKINIPNSVSTISTSVFQGCVQLLDAVLPSNNSYTQIGTSLFRDCASLTTVTIPLNITAIGTTAFYACSSLTSVNLPQYISSILDNAFNYCSLLADIHIAAIAPPTLGTSVFANLPSDFIIYVPVGTLSAYQSAWSAYADHIVEEGRSLSKAQLRRIAEAEKKSEESEER